MTIFICHGEVVTFLKDRDLLFYRLKNNSQYLQINFISTQLNKTTTSQYEQNQDYLTKFSNSHFKVIIIRGASLVS